jgi:hypothetical protein
MGTEDVLMYSQDPATGIFTDRKGSIVIPQPTFTKHQFY